jgi:cytochrome c biogenesis protein
LSRPSDHYDSAAPVVDPDVTQPRLGFVGSLRWFWRQLTSMRTALFLLLLLAIAAVPGSLVPQRSSDPNGVTQYFTAHPQLAPFLDKLQAFDVYTSVWFSAIYLLLFISLIGCVIPRTKHHFDALRAKPPRTPARLVRMAGFTSRDVPAATDGGATAAQAIESARSLLKRGRYRIAIFEEPARGQSPASVSVSAERGYIRETGNLVFHSALVGILLAVGFGSGFGFTGQKVVVVGQSFVNNLVSYDSFDPGRFVGDTSLQPFSIQVKKLSVSYDTTNVNALGDPLDYTAYVTSKGPGSVTRNTTIKVNDPLGIGGTQVYLLGNGYAPTITVRNPEGTVVFQDSVPFLPQDANLTSLGVVKVPDGLRKQLGMIGFFYPTKGSSQTAAGAMASTFPGLRDPLLTLNVYSGDLGLDKGVPVSVYALNTDKLTQLTGGATGTDSLELKLGQTVQLPQGLGSVTLSDIKRYATLDVHYDPSQGFVLVFAVLVLGGLLTSLFIPRRRLWVKVIEKEDGGLRVEYAGLARGDDPRLDDAVDSLADKHSASLIGHENT